MPSDRPFALPEPAFSQHLGLLAISSQQTDQEFPGLMLPPSQHLPGAVSRPGLCWVGLSGGVRAGAQRWVMEYRPAGEAALTPVPV